jgi:hypothetical protein
VLLVPDRRPTSAASCIAQTISNSRLIGNAALILVATLGGPTMFARIGIMRALNRHVERMFDSSRKDHHWGRRKLAREC